MPYRTPPRIRRRPMGYGRRNVLVPYSRRAAVPRALRMIGAPSMMHTFARPGARIMITQTTGGGWQANGAGLAGGISGVSFGTASPGDLINTSNIAIGQVFQFNLLSNFSDLSNLYDNFRIKAVKLRIDLSFNSTPGTFTSGATALTGANCLPMLHYAVDQDDASPPANSMEVLSFSKSRSVRLGDKPLFITLTPRAQGGIISAVNPTGATTAGAGTMLPLNTWLDSGNAQSVPHYGVKYFLENMPTNSTTGGLNWAIYITPVYILQCKNVN